MSEEQKAEPLVLREWDAPEEFTIEANGYEVGVCGHPQCGLHVRIYMAPAVGVMPDGEQSEVDPCIEIVLHDDDMKRFEAAFAELRRRRTAPGATHAGTGTRQ